MSKSNDTIAPTGSAEPDRQAGQPTDSRGGNASSRETRRWWIKLFLQPVLFLLGVVMLIASLGIAQHYGLLSSADGGAGHTVASGGNTRYICPMMCTPPQTEPGRCPVCAMELVPAASAGNADPRSIQIDPAARRVANIQTVAVKSASTSRAIRAVGVLSYDEGALKTISAYVDGRIDRLYADYTGALVNKGDHLALVYSPRLYSSQVELLLAKKASEASRSSTVMRVTQSSRDLYASARQRLIELGMTEAQIAQLEKNGDANSRMHLCAPISGTVIEKLAVEGQYVKEGQAIYKLADLSTVWLMLELFPDDAAIIRFGQKVIAEVQSLPGRAFEGRVAFIDPTVDSKTRTVGVRVVIENDDGLIRVGDYAKATINVPLADTQQTQVHDPELAIKWISPRHPHVVESSAGVCPICGVDLVPAAQLGFTDQPIAGNAVLLIPRDAVLMAGNNSVVYVETQPGRFEIRRVVLGPQCGDQVVVRSGVQAGEQVATRGNFLIDSQMQLAGNPSLIDPTKAQPIESPEVSHEVTEALAKLSEGDRQLAEEQRVCPVTRMLLGSMGTPTKVDLDGQTVFLCCKGCEEPLSKDPQTYLANLPRDDSSRSNAQITTSLAKLSTADRELALRQRICPVAGYRLGTMGAPIRVDIHGTPVFICCEGCRESLLESPEEYLSKLSNTNGDRDAAQSLPPAMAPERLEPHGGLPPILPLRPMDGPSGEDLSLPIMELPEGMQ